MIPPAEASALIAAALPAYPSVSLPLAKAAGRILRSALRADRDYPPFHRVAMDGIAIASSAWEAGYRRFSVEGRQKAGEALRKLVSERGCLEVMTGAVLPEGADCVIPVEQITLEGSDAVVSASTQAQACKPWRHVHTMGSDCKAGDIVVPSGAVITPPRIGVAASFGITRVEVAYSPSVAILATGDELVDPASDPGPSRIRRSNPYAIEAALRLRRIDRVALLHVRDEPSRLRKTLEGLLPKCDVIIVTGGVSMGKTDHVPQVLKEIGVRPIFHKVRQKPGKPFWFGTAPPGPAAAGSIGGLSKPVFALPGNPASVLVCLYRYVLPALREAMGGHPEPLQRAVLEESAAAPGTLAAFLPVTLRATAEGHLSAALVENRGSGDFSGWAASDGFVELPQGESLPAGSAVPLYLW